MALDDYMEPEVGIAVAVTAAVASPQVRNVLRRGAVYGLAGLLMAGDAISTLAQGVKRGAQQAAAPDAPAAASVDTAPAEPVILRADEPLSMADEPLSMADEPLSMADEPLSKGAEPMAVNETPSASEPVSAASAGHKRVRKTPEATSNE